jgi:hypothetical protein
MAGAWLDAAFGLRDNWKGTPDAHGEDNDMTSDAMRALILARCPEVSAGELEALIEPDRTSDAMADVMARVFDILDELDERLGQLESALR